MSWHGVFGHDRIVELFRLALTRHRLASSFLFTGPSGIGKRTFALRLAQALLCQKHSEESLDPCGTCSSCIQVAAGTHPDLDIVAKPEEKSFLPLDLLIGDKEHRRREGLCHNLALKPFMGGRKVAVLDDADYLNEEGANALLKTLEEPPPQSVLILIGTSPAKQLPTIRSRCQLIRFHPLEEAIVAQILRDRGFAASKEEAERLARLSGGSIEQAQKMAAPELASFRRMFFQRLAEVDFNSVALAQTVSKFVEEAGKEASLRRQRLHQVVDFAADFHRGWLRAEEGLGGDNDPEMQSVFQGAMQKNLSGEAIAERLSLCLESQRIIDRNVNATTFVESWLDSLVEKR